MKVWGVPDSSVGKESGCNAGNPGLIPDREDCWRRDWLPTPVFLGTFNGNPCLAQARGGLEGV